MTVENLLTTPSRNLVAVLVAETDGAGSFLAAEDGLSSHMTNFFAGPYVRKLQYQIQYYN